MSTLKVTVKWQKDSFDVDVDTSQPPSVLKAQLFALTGVPPERQKIMGVKGGMLKDDAEWGATGVKAGSKLMMMGTADKPPEAPKEGVVFVEDLAPGAGAGAGAGAAASATAAAGLENLGNTCYMNATVQCLFQVPELKTALDELDSSASASSSSSSSSAGAAAAADAPSRRLALATRETFSALRASAAAAAAAAAVEGDAVTPHALLSALRARFPQFAQAGPGGVPAQQDAEECWSQLLFVLKECLREKGAATAAATTAAATTTTSTAAAVGVDETDASPPSASSPSPTPRSFASAIDRLFGIGTRAVLTCEETGESVTVDGDGRSSPVSSTTSSAAAASSSPPAPAAAPFSSASALALKCNITADVNHLNEGIALGLAEDREMRSEKLGGNLALFKGSSQLTRLPPYLTVQLVRFFYKVDVGQKAKVLRKVSFPMTLDVHQWCSEALKRALEGPRAAASAAAAAAAVAGRAGGAGGGEEKKEAENNGSNGTTTTATTTTAAAAAADIAMTDAEPSTSSSSSSPSHERFSGRPTGRYDLVAVLTHKGRSADSGHYVAWARDDKDPKRKRWLQFDDDDVIERSGEDVLALSGGGDWHMAYLLLYKAELAP